MLSPKYYTQLLQDIKNAHNPNPPTNLNHLFTLEDDQKEDQMFFDSEEKPLTGMDDLGPETAVPDDEDNDEEDEQKMLDYFEEVEAYLDFDKDNHDTFGVSIGLDQSMFPKANLYDEDQLQEINLAFNNMLRSHRISADIPSELDASLKYMLLISILDETLFLGHTGIVGWDWCTEDSKVCPYGEHCTCIEIERDIENEMSDSKNALRALRTGVNEFVEEGRYFKYEIDHNLIGEFDNMSMFISYGIPDIPRSVALYRNRWRDTIVDLKHYLKNYPQLVALFNEEDPMHGYKTLEDFLGLATEFISRSYFRIEPFYIEDGRIIRGYKAPDVEFPSDDIDSPRKDSYDDKDLPF